jgi:hypothetical protein
MTHYRYLPQKPEAINSEARIKGLGPGNWNRKLRTVNCELVFRFSLPLRRKPILVPGLPAEPTYHTTTALFLIVRFKLIEDQYVSRDKI